MAKANIADEVQVLRFFESGPIEKAEVLFNIVSEKMRERLHATSRDQEGSAPLGSRRKRGAEGKRDAHAETPESRPQE